MASIRAFKRELEAGMDEFYFVCELHMNAAKNEADGNAIYELATATHDSLGGILSRLKAYDAKAGRKEVRAHFDAIRKEVEKLLSDSLDRLHELTLGAQQTA